MDCNYLCISQMFCLEALSKILRLVIKLFDKTRIRKFRLHTGHRNETNVRKFDLFLRFNILDPNVEVVFKHQFCFEPPFDLLQIYLNFSFDL